MNKVICSGCEAVFDDAQTGKCPSCGLEHPHIHEFHNNDTYLKEQVPRIIEKRRSLGLEGLVGGLEAVIINTQPDRHQDAVNEILRFTGHDFHAAFEDAGLTKSVMRLPGSADLIIQSRQNGENPFLAYNNFPKSRSLPDARLETFVFRVHDIDDYVKIQESRGIEFLTEGIIRKEHYNFIQTPPSAFTGTSIGFIQWTGDQGEFVCKDVKVLDARPEKSHQDLLANIKQLDHTALRVRAKDRDAAIIEFVELTNYHFDFAIYVKMFNSITNVARLSDGEFAMVFTSGISPYVNDEVSGPTEKFIHNYGTRVHHMAFVTENIESTFEVLKNNGMKFLIDLVGAPDDGLKQTFSEQSPYTLLVNEYIHRYGDFDGFFSKSNVTLLTGATDKQ